MDASVSDLGDAVEYLARLERDLASGQRRGPEWRRALEFEMEGMRQELQEVHTMLAAAGKFYAGWARLVTVADDAPANYTAQGTSGSLLEIQSGKVVAIG
jgi:hypothetical protein